MPDERHEHVCDPAPRYVVWRRRDPAQFTFDDAGPPPPQVWTFEGEFSADALFWLLSPPPPIGAFWLEPSDDGIEGPGKEGRNSDMTQGNGRCAFSRRLRWIMREDYADEGLSAIVGGQDGQALEDLAVALDAAVLMAHEPPLTRTKERFLTALRELDQHA